MAKKSVWLVAAAVVAALCVGGCTVTVNDSSGSSSSDGSGFSQSDFTEKTESFENVSSITVDVVIGDINISKGDGFSVTCSFPEEYMPSMECTDGNLNVTLNTSDSISLKDGATATVTITVPEDFKLTDMSLKTSLGSMDLKDLVSENFKAETAVGDIVMDYCVFQTVNIESELGNITGTEIGFDSGTVHAESGDVSMDGDFDSIDASTDLGTATVNGKEVE